MFDVRFSQTFWGSEHFSHKKLMGDKGKHLKRVQGDKQGTEPGELACFNHLWHSRDETPKARFTFQSPVSHTGKGSELGLVYSSPSQLCLLKVSWGWLSPPVRRKSGFRGPTTTRRQRREQADSGPRAPPATSQQTSTRFCRSE